jgi:nucleotide-binding universal stress UspA family protein
MATARQVEILSVGEDEAAVGESRADVIRYLGWHGITATARQVKPLSRSVGDTLLHEASEAGIDVLVMGAYSHGRMRELLLGGVTRHVTLERRRDPRIHGALSVAGLVRARWRPTGQ